MALDDHSMGAPLTAEIAPLSAPPPQTGPDRPDPVPLNLTKSGSRLGDRAYRIVLTSLASVVLIALF